MFDENESIPSEDLSSDAEIEKDLETADQKRIRLAKGIIEEAKLLKKREREEEEDYQRMKGVVEDDDVTNVLQRKLV